MNIKQLFEKSKSVAVTEDAHGGILLTISRKSRFIRKDAEKLLEKIYNSGLEPEKIMIKFNAPLCSKAKAFLESRKIKIRD